MKNYRYFKLFKLHETKSCNNPVVFILKCKTFILSTLNSFFPKIFSRYAVNETVKILLLKIAKI